MVLSRRFLRVAALGAVFALGLAGTALAAQTYVITGNAEWTKDGIAGGSTATANDDTVIIKEGAVLTATLETAADIDVKFLDMAGGKLIVKGTTKSLKIANGGEIRVSKKGSVIQLEETVGAAAIKFDAANAPVVLSDDVDLTIERTGTGADGGITGIGAALEIKGKGTLVLAAPVAAVNDLKITEGGTLIVEADTDNKGALPALTGTANAVTIDNGNIIVNAEHFGVGAAGAVQTLTMKKGALELKEPLATNIKTVDMQDGDLFVLENGAIGVASPADGALNLGGGATFSGHLHLQRSMVLAKLTTADVANTIDIASGNTLTVAPAVADNFNLNLNATVTGDLKLEMKDGKTATLNKNVDGKVEFKAPSGGTATLALAADVKVDAVDFTAAAVGDTFKLDLGGRNWIGTLSFAKTNDGLVVKSDGTPNAIGFLVPADEATLKMDGTKLLRVLGGTKDAKWNAELAAGTQLAVTGKDLLTGEVEMAINGGALTLPSGKFEKLKLKEGGAGSTISVDVAEENPVLKVNTVELGNNGLKVNRPIVWGEALAAGGEITLLSMDTFTNPHNKVIVGAPDSDDVALIEWKPAPDNVLLLKPRDGFKVPVLKGRTASSGNQCNVTVEVVDGKVAPATWDSQLWNVVALGSATFSPLATPTAESALYKVQLTDGFKSGFLRVTAKKESGSKVEGFVDVPLKRGDNNGGEPNTPSIDPASWSRTAISGDSVVLTSKLKLDGTPKSLKVKASGMKNEPKAELLDAAGKVVAKSSVPSVSAVKDYTLKLTCKTTQAEIDKGAKIEQVTVTMSDGKTHTIPVNVKLSDMKIGTPDTKKPGGDNGGGKTPGGDNGGGKNPGGEDGGGKNPGGEDGGKKGSSGGGCDAGFGGVALALGAAFLLKRKA